MKAIGVLGGTFDPIHLGHLALAVEARGFLDLERVLFVPNADPPHKRDQAVTPAEHRAAMVALAIAAEPMFELSRLELDRPGPSYAVDTVEVIAADSRAAGRPEPWFILSAEVLATLYAWHRPERVLELTRIAVAPRPGASAMDHAWITAEFPGAEDRFTFLPGPELDIASTTVRELIAAGEPVDGLVPDAVAVYIERAGLYRGEAAIGREDS